MLSHEKYDRMALPRVKKNEFALNNIHNIFAEKQSIVAFDSII